PDGEMPVIRPSAYGLIPNGRGQLAVVRTARGIFLPGGGIEVGETPEAAVMREAFEECGLIVRLGVWSARAVQFVSSEPEGAHFEKRSTFIEGAVEEERDDSTGLEDDHQLVWVNLKRATGILTLPSHSWAVERRRIRSPG